MGVWIEIVLFVTPLTVIIVTPCVGVWIEIDFVISVPSCLVVTPCVGVWIEILVSYARYLIHLGHSLRGSVD